jgi:hypothetical protein
MKPGARYLAGGAGLVALSAIAGCSHYLLAQREPWRHDAELACLNAGVPQQLPGRVRIASIEGPGACGIDYPLKVSEIGENAAPLGYTDEALRPPASIPGSYSSPAASGGAPQHWPVIESNSLPPVQAAPSEDAAGYPEPYPEQAPYRQPSPSEPSYGEPSYGGQSYGRPAYGTPEAVAPSTGAPMSLQAPAGAPAGDDDFASPGGSAHPYDREPQQEAVTPSLYSPRPLSGSGPPQQSAPSAEETVPPLGPARAPGETAASDPPVQLHPAATLACPIVSALDKWVAGVVQPAALKWFHQPVVEIKQIGSYSCRGMNGNPNAHISEHAYGNALDIAEFDLADGHRISVEYGWIGAPDEQGFLHDVQGGACRDFTTVLAPGANIYHYNHIHVDLMQRAHRRYICEPAAIPGEVAAARARARYAGGHGYRGITGSIRPKPYREPPGYSDRLPLATPGED